MKPERELDEGAKKMCEKLLTVPRLSSFRGSVWNEILHKHNFIVFGKLAILISR